MKKITYQSLILIMMYSTCLIAQQQDLWTTFTVADGLAGNMVVKIFEASDGALWVGTDGGVTFYYERVWSTFTTTNGLANNAVNAICESSNGAIWFGSLRGGLNSTIVRLKRIASSHIRNVF